MSALDIRLVVEPDFDRAFDMALRLIEFELRMKWLPDMMTPGMANDTMAAMTQARNLVKLIHRSGYTLEDMSRWVEGLVAADEEERARLKELVTT